MNIREFKEGDLVTRIAPCRYGNGVEDFSYVGDRLELVGIENGIMFLVGKLYHDEPTDLEIARGWDEGWDYYPEALYQKAKKRMQELKKN